MMVLIMIGLFVLTVVLLFLSMGDDVNQKQMDLNGFINSVVGFPIGQFPKNIQANVRKPIHHQKQRLQSNG